MSIEQLNSFSSILSVNPYDNEYANSVSNFLNKEKNPKYLKQQFVTSYLNTQSYINNHIEISKNIPNEDIYDAINIKIYDELGLDQAIEYQMQYIETLNDVDDENRRFQVFLFGHPYSILPPRPSLSDLLSIPRKFPFKQGKSFK